MVANDRRDYAGVSNTCEVAARRAWVVTATTTRHGGIIAGPVRAIHPAINLIGCDHQYNHRRHEYNVPIQFPR